MKGKKFTPEQIIRKLREGEGLIASGMSVEQDTKQLSIGLSTWHRWKAGYQNMSTSEVRRCIPESPGNPVRIMSQDIVDVVNPR